MSWFVKYVSTYRKYEKSRKGKKLYEVLESIKHAELSDEAAMAVGQNLIAFVGKLNLENLGKSWKVGINRKDDEIFIAVSPDDPKTDSDYVCTIFIVRISSSLYVDDLKEIFFSPEEEGGDE